LWQALRNRKLEGFRFRRQHAIRQFIVVFYCREAKLVIEIDGPSHDGAEEYDAERTIILDALGFHVLRFSNEEVLADLPGVLERISQALNRPT
jgi:very-short-patch-repair endonuclease